MKTRLPQSLVSLCSVLLLGTAIEKPANAFDAAAAPYYHAHRLIEIAGGHKLNLYCVGSGEPVVIFDYGWGGPPTAWEYIQTAIGRRTTACTYDRAGYGFSDAGPMPRDTSALVTDLHQLLQAAHLKPPYVYVGHSLAGLNGTLFADRYLNQMAGMVLVDPAFAHQDEKFDAIPGIKEKFAQYEPDYAECIAVAKSGKLPTGAKQIQDCLDRDPHDDATARTVKDQWDMSVAHWLTLQSEDESATSPSHGKGLDDTELDAARRNWGDLPLIILTSSDKHYAGFSATQIPVLSATWKAGHDELASRSTHGSNIVVPDSSHYIQLDHPDAVIQAIEQVLKMASEPSSHPRGTH
jgi:pimeloyl-ACP methyl ester carboxylesterase